jgi:hypothetical protein
VFVGGKEKTSLTAQIALVGHIVNGTPDIEAGDSPVTFMPGFIQ